MDPTFQAVGEHAAGVGVHRGGLWFGTVLAEKGSSPILTPIC